MHEISSALTDSSSASLSERGQSPSADRISSNATKRENWQKIAITLLLITLSIVISVAWWPIKESTFEADSVHIAYGATSFIFDDSNPPMYRYECQSGTYRTVEYLSRMSRVLGFGIKPLLGFRLLTIASFLLFAFSATSLLHTLLGYPKWFCLVSLFLFQETYVSSYYPNSNMMALCWGMSALALIAAGTSWQRCCLAGILYGIAVWMRIDMVLLCLAFPVLMKPVRLKDWAKVGAVTGLAVALSNLLIWLSGVSLYQVVSSYQSHVVSSTKPELAFSVYISIFTALILCTTLCGLGKLWNQRNWQLIALVAVGFLPSVLAFGFSVTTPKYLLYSLTFVAIASTAGLWWLLNSVGNWGRGIVFSLFLIQYVVNPFWMHESKGVVSTHDCPRRIGSIIAGPWDWYKSNRGNARQTERVRQYVEDFTCKEQQGVIAVQNFSHRALVPYCLLLEGYQFQRSKRGKRVQARHFKRGEQKITLLTLDLARKTPLKPEELVELGIHLPRTVQVLGKVKPEMLSFSGKPRVRGTGKYGSYIVQCRAPQQSIQK